MVSSVRVRDSAPRPSPRLHNLNKAADASGEFKEDVLDPLKSGASLNGYQASQPLGVAGSALGGVYGVGTIISGVREVNPKLVISGAAETTVAAAGLAALGVIDGGGWLTPVGAGLLMVRGMQRISAPSRAATHDGLTDAVTAAALVAGAIHSPTAITLGLGLTATGVSLMRGLNRIYQGHTDGDARLKIRGTGELVSSIGLAALLAHEPGTALVFAGASVSLLQRVPLLRPHIDRMVRFTDRLLFPMAQRSETSFNFVANAVEPAARVADELRSSVTCAVSPVLQPLAERRRRIEYRILESASRALDRIAATPIFHKIDTAVGALRDKLLPEPEVTAGADAATPGKAAPAS